jgi:hypothetical protein
VHRRLAQSFHVGDLRHSGGIWAAAILPGHGHDVRDHGVGGAQRFYVSASTRLWSMNGARLAGYSAFQKRRFDGINASEISVTRMHVPQDIRESFWLSSYVDKPMAGRVR